MKRVAFVFASAPHGTSSGREGLDALIAVSALKGADIGVFFISDGVLQLLAGQQPKTILSRDYISTFKVLPLYDVEIFWVCASSLRERGLSKDISMILNVTVVDSDILREELSSYNVVLTF